MEHEFSLFGSLINRLLGPLVLPLLQALGLSPHDPQHPIPDHIATALFIVVLCVIFFTWFRTRLSVENPGALQLGFEQLLSNGFRVGIYDLLDEIVGHGGRKHLAIVGTIGLFVLFCNAISLVPAFMSPTAVHSVPLGCALAVFLYYNYAGIAAHGALGYGKHFLGPVLPMAPLMLPIELISHLARLLSLTVRLWVNMVVSELLYLTFLGLGLAMVVGSWHISKLLGAAAVLAPGIIPLPFILLHVFVAFLQAFVFTLLPIVYLGGAVAEEH